MGATGPGNCSICQQAISWSQLFTFTAKGPLHFDCFRKQAPSDPATQGVLQALEGELRLIVAYKGLLGKVQNPEEKALLEGFEKDAERHAARLTKMADRAPK
ncbi:MAG: DUF2175 family protein [Euryarchaeota archaeon]|nr:DUF2175 family protein [Euryarchaeota archaeon]